MVFDKIKDIIVEQLDVEEDAVTMEASITEDLGADSLDVVDLVMSIEESFDVEIPDEEVENIKTVGDIVKYIENKVEECFKKLCFCTAFFILPDLWNMHKMGVYLLKGIDK